MREKQYRYITIWEEEVYPNIIFGKYAPNLHIDLEIAKELVDNRLEFTSGKACYVLIDSTNLKAPTKEARDYMSTPEGGLKGILGGAFIAGNIVTTVVFNFFLEVSKPAVPAKFFTTKESALEWLCELNNKE